MDPLLIHYLWQGGFHQALTLVTDVLIFELTMQEGQESKNLYNILNYNCNKILVTKQEGYNVEK